MSDKPEVLTKEQIWEQKLEKFDWKVLDTLLSVGHTKKTCALYLGKNFGKDKICVETIDRYIKRKFDMQFTEYAEMQLIDTKIKLSTKAIDMGLDGNATMLIFCLKNINKWTDKPIIDDARMEDMAIEELKMIINKANQYVADKEAARKAA